MLHQLFKLVTLALSADGIAMSASGQLPRLLTNVSVKLSTNELLLDAFTEALQDADLQKSSKRIRLVVSNHFVRYSVLPWQPEIISREDWLAIAQHDFRKRYGPVTERWTVCVSLNGFGNNVVASAIDKSLLDGLSSVAQEYGFKIIATEPFLMSVIKQYHAGDDNQWLLIAEPERVLLCEMADNQWQRFSIISPPHQQEIEQGLLLIHRCIQSAEPEKCPTHILNCSAPSLFSAQAGGWHCDQVAFKFLPKVITAQGLAAALWMAGF